MNRIGRNVGPDRAALEASILCCPKCGNCDYYAELNHKIVRVFFTLARGRFEMATIGACRSCGNILIWETGFLGNRARRKA